MDDGHRRAAVGDVGGHDRPAAGRGPAVLRGAAAHTKPGSMLKSQIPMRTWADGTSTGPGSWRSTWSATRAATTTATSPRPDRDRHRDRLDRGPDRAGQGGRHVFARLVEIRRVAVPDPGDRLRQRQRVHQRPAAPLVPAQQMKFTRSRPANKNDGATWSRRTGPSPAARSATCATTPPASWPCSTRSGALQPLINLFYPQQKLITKIRDGAKVTKTYAPRQTPYQRLLAHPEALNEHRRRPPGHAARGHQPSRCSPPGRSALRHPAAAGPPRNRHRPSPNRPRLPIRTKINKRRSSGHLQMSQRIEPAGQVGTIVGRPGRPSGRA